MFHYISTITRRVSTLAGAALLIGLTACAGDAARAPAVEPVAQEAITVEVRKEVEAEAVYITPPQAAGGQVLSNGAPYDLMFFESTGVNPFVATKDDHLSTYALDVDTASYTVARRYITDGHLPPPDAIRVEEFINYFDLHYPGPAEDEGAFAIHLEGAPSRFGPRHTYLLKVDLQGKGILAENRKDANLTFVVDVSGSMNQENRLGLVKRALRLLVGELRPTDQVGLVVYGSRARVILEPTSAEHAQAILSAIDRLQPDGSTNAEAGLRLGYQLATRAYRPGAINRVILLSCSRPSVLGWATTTTC
jgi:Ca-activated chloride channel family protein